MKAILFFLLLANSIWATAQEKYIFDTSKVDATIKIIGRYPQYDKQKSYKKFNFIITDPETIKTVIMRMPLGKEGLNETEDPDFMISIIQKFDEVKTWTVNPTLQSVMSNGHTYAFDVSILKELSQKYPFDYRFDKIPFNSKSDYEEYLEKQMTNATFLFDYGPQFSYEGSFDIQFPRNNRFSSPKAISDYLTPIIEKIVAEDEYRLGYILNEKNMNDQTQYTMTISGSKKLYEQLQIDNLKNENWKKTVEIGWFFYRIK